MSKHWKHFKKHCFEIVIRAQAVNITIVMKPLRETSKKLRVRKKHSVLAQLLSYLKEPRAWPISCKKCRKIPANNRNCGVLVGRFILSQKSSYLRQAKRERLKKPPRVGQACKILTSIKWFFVASFDVCKFVLMRTYEFEPILKVH